MGSHAMKLAIVTIFLKVNKLGRVEIIFVM